MSDIKRNVQILLDAEPQCAKNTTLLVIRYWMKIEGITEFAGALSGTAPDEILYAFRDIMAKNQKGSNRSKAIPHFINLNGDDI